MATTIKQSFSVYASNLNITDKQEETVSNCHNNVTRVIKKKLDLHKEESKVIGSWDRNTLIKYLSENDVDLMVILHYGKNKNWDNPAGTVAALDKFKEILDEAYPDTKKWKDRNCITMQLSKFKLDVVPAFKYDDGTTSYYKIPDTYRKQWLPTDPFSFASRLTTINKNMGQTFIPLIKMVKGWNRDNGKLIRSFHLESVMYYHYKSYNQSFTYSSTLNVFFGSLADRLSKACYDPITNDRLDGYMDNSSQTTIREMAVSKAKKAAEIAQKAYDYEKAGEDYEEYAIYEWKKLLGEFFPAYG